MAERVVFLLPVRQNLSAAEPRACLDNDETDFPALLVQIAIPDFAKRTTARSHREGIELAEVSQHGVTYQSCFQTAVTARDGSAGAVNDLCA